jgi:hypothetical protein
MATNTSDRHVETLNRDLQAAQEELKAGPKGFVFTATSVPEPLRPGLARHLNEEVLAYVTRHEAHERLDRLETDLRNAGMELRDFEGRVVRLVPKKTEEEILRLQSAEQRSSYEAELASARKANKENGKFALMAGAVAAFYAFSVGISLGAKSARKSRWEHLRAALRGESEE